MGNFRVKIILLQLQLLTLVIFPVAASAQSSDEMKKIFSQAESYYLYEEFELANQLYILLDSPDNLILSIKLALAISISPGKKKSQYPTLKLQLKQQVMILKLSL
jgi:hypothetical protein